MAKASYIRLIDFRTPRNFVDMHPLYRNAEAVDELIRDMSFALERFSPEIICGIQSQGFILGSALALHLHKPFVPIEKYDAEPQLPSYTASLKDYSRKWKNLGLRRSSMAKGSRCALIDDWIETGTQVRCATELIAQAGGIVVCIAVVHADRNDFVERLRREGKLVEMVAS